MNARAYYNEIDPFAAQWLRNLIKKGLIADGEVDTRSIVDVRYGDLDGFAQCHFFAGIGGWSYALRKAGWADDRPVWTGSCPCQPFSLAGKQKGFDDSRHLWPHFRRLIAQCDPPVVFGEQVASATEWLGLVRGDLEAMGYAVGAMPIQAASAGADHLRDRYWFVAHADHAGSQGRRLLPERAGERLAGQDGVADADEFGASAERPERSGQLCGAGSDPQTCLGGNMADSDGLRGQIDQDAGRCDYGSLARKVAGLSGVDDGDLGDAIGTGAGRHAGDGFSSEASSDREGREDGCRSDASVSPSPELEWVYGADGKARRVKSGIRLLAHGVPGRVGKLRGFGNAIDPRPATEFIIAASEAMT